MTELYVGQEVVLWDINYRKPHRGKITRVGRTLVDIAAPYYLGATPFRINTRAINDRYGRTRFFTLDEWAEKQEREALAQRARSKGWGRIDYWNERLSVSKLRRIVEILEEED